MDKKKSVPASSSSSFNHIFGPKLSSSSSSSPSSSVGLFKSIFPHPSPGTKDLTSHAGAEKYQHSNERREKSKKKEKKNYYNEETQAPCHLSSSIYYGGQEKYSSTTTTTQDAYNKDGDEGDSKSASRGNWWEGSLYY